MKNIEGWRLNKRMKSNVYVKSIPGATTKGMKHHVRGCLEDNSPDTTILHFGTNNLKNNERAEDIATDITNLAISHKISDCSNICKKRKVSVYNRSK